MIGSSGGVTGVGGGVGVGGGGVGDGVFHGVPSFHFCPRVTYGPRGELVFGFLGSYRKEPLRGTFLSMV